MDTAQLAAVASSHRVYRSFGFVDLCGFTDFAEANGDDIAVLELRRLRTVVREVTPLFGVRVEKWLGDGMMAVGVDNEPVVAAVVAIQQRHQLTGSLSVRAGIAAGEVLLLEGDDYTGRGVNVAARLCDHAQAGQILAAVDGLRTPPWVSTRREEPARLKGIVDAVETVSLEPNLDIVPPSRPNPVGSLGCRAHSADARRT